MHNDLITLRLYLVLQFLSISWLISVNDCRWPQRKKSGLARSCGSGGHLTGPASHVQCLWIEMVHYILILISTLLKICAWIFIKKTYSIKFILYHMQIEGTGPASVSIRDVGTLQFCNSNCTVTINIILKFKPNFKFFGSFLGFL